MGLERHLRGGGTDRGTQQEHVGGLDLRRLCCRHGGTQQERVGVLDRRRPHSDVRRQLRPRCDGHLHWAHREDLRYWPLRLKLLHHPGLILRPRQNSTWHHQHSTWHHQHSTSVLRRHSLGVAVLQHELKTLSVSSICASVTRARRRQRQVVCVLTNITQVVRVLTNTTLIPAAAVHACVRPEILYLANKFFGERGPGLLLK